MDLKLSGAVVADLGLHLGNSVRDIFRDELGSFFKSDLQCTRGLHRAVDVTLDGTGDGTARLTNTNSAALWVVRRVSAIAPGGNSTLVQVNLPIGFWATLRGVEDGASEAANDSPLYLRRGDYLDFVVDGGPVAPGKAYVTVFYDEIIGGNDARD